MTMLQTIDEMIQLIPQDQEDQAAKYGNTLAALLSLQNKAGKIEKERTLLNGEVASLEERKETLAKGYSDQLAYRNELLSYRHELPKESARETAAEQEARALQRLAKTNKSLF